MANEKEPSTNGEPSTSTTLARAKFDFDGKNNDELTFAKNDVITITQQLDGGWWEGTLNGMTGWFPMNYVVILSEKDKLLRSRSVPNASVANGHSAGANEDFAVTETSRATFRSEIMKDYLESENKYIESLSKTCNIYLTAINKSKVLSADDYATLSCQLDKILAVQKDVLKEIIDNSSKDHKDQRIGGVFLSIAPILRKLLLAYCENHPRAVEVINEKMDVLKGVMVAAGGDLPSLIAGLSEPFRRLDKYPSVLQELERNIAENHADRGDVQRSYLVFRDLKILCEAIRKQKELQLEFFYTGQVEKWASFEERGRILYVGTVQIEDANGSSSDRFLALFSNLIFQLEVTEQVNIYNVLAKIPTSKLVVRKLDGKFGFTYGPEQTVVCVASSFEVDRWMEALQKCPGLIVGEPLTVTPKKFAVENMNAMHPPQMAEFVELRPERAQFGKKASFGPSDFKFNHELEMILPEGFDDVVEEQTKSSRRSQSQMCIRLVPPLRPTNGVELNGAGKKNIKLRKDGREFDRDDQTLLRIIEGYCSGAARAAQQTDGQQPPQLIVAEDEKILVEEMVGDEMVLQEKSLVDTVYALKDQVASLRHEVTNLYKVVEKEQKCRRRLEEHLRRNSQSFMATSTPKSGVDL